MWIHQQSIKFIILIVIILYILLSSNLFSQDISKTISICTVDGVQKGVQMVSDGNGGAILIWLDSRMKYRSQYGRHYYDLYAQRVNGEGSTLWTMNDVSVATSVDFEESDTIIGLYPKIVMDGIGGAIIGWVHPGENNNRDIYVQYINKEGKILWQGNGKAICSAPNMQFRLNMISDNAGGAILTWQDYREGRQKENTMFSNMDIYVQRVNSQGSTLWQYNGMPICRAPYDQGSPNLVTDGNNGAIIEWLDGRIDTNSYNNPLIYAQRVNSFGSTLWTLDGVAICTVKGRKDSIKLVPDGEKGAVIFWDDTRSIIYTQRINSVGSTLWQPDGMPISNLNILRWDHYQIALAEEGNILAVWREDLGNSQSGLYAQKINNEGSLLWSPKGVQICSNDGLLAKPQIISDGKGGAMIASWGIANWSHKDDIFLQRIDAKGNILWNINSLIPDSTFRYQYEPQILMLNKNKVLIGWYGGKTMDYDIYIYVVDIVNQNLR